MNGEFALLVQQTMAYLSTGNFEESHSSGPRLCIVRRVGDSETTRCGDTGGMLRCGSAHALFVARTLAYLM